MKIQLYKWHPGLRTIPLMKLIQKYEGSNLKSAKEIVDDFLDGGQPLIHINNRVDPKELRRDFQILGTEIKIIEEVS